MPTQLKTFPARLSPFVIRLPERAQDQRNADINPRLTYREREIQQGYSKVLPGLHRAQTSVYHTWQLTTSCRTEMSRTENVRSQALRVLVDTAAVSFMADYSGIRKIYATYFYTYIYVRINR